MENVISCPICGIGVVTKCVEHVHTEHNGHKGQVPLHYQQCDTCGSEFAGAAEMQANKQALLAFRARVEQLTD